jgi:hypothetical protein
MNKIRTVCFVLVFLFGSANAKADTPSYGVELDALPYLTGGYYLSGWVGVNNCRFRVVSASTTVPDFAVKSGFKENDIDANALIIDYFPHEKYAGIWYGIGVERWKQSIQDEAGTGEGKFQNTVATFGVGYVWYFSKNFYLNPWAAAHLLMSGTDDVQVGSSIYSPQRTYPEASIKLGYSF